MPSVRSLIVTVAAVGAAAAGGSAVAGAASSSSTTPTAASTPAAGSSTAARPDPSKGGHTLNGKTEKLLTGDAESKVKAAALAKVPGTVERVETNVDSSAPYEAHIKKADGTQVEVQVDSSFAVTAVNSMGGHP